MGLCVFSLVIPISRMMTVRICLPYLIIIIKSEVLPICQCLGLGHETMVYAGCHFIFLRNNNVIITPDLCRDVVLTSYWRYNCVACVLFSCPCILTHYQPLYLTKTMSWPNADWASVGAIRIYVHKSNHHNAIENTHLKSKLHLPSENRLTHWGRVTHICVSKLTIIGSDNGLSPERRQANI